jgi:hypothetical protein
MRAKLISFIETGIRVLSLPAIFGEEKISAEDAEGAEVAGRILWMKSRGVRLVVVGRLVGNKSAKNSKDAKKGRLAQQWPNALSCPIPPIETDNPIPRPLRLLRTFF